MRCNRDILIRIRLLDTNIRPGIILRLKVMRTHRRVMRLLDTRRKVILPVMHRKVILRRGMHRQLIRRADIRHKVRLQLMPRHKDMRFHDKVIRRNKGIRHNRDTRHNKDMRRLRVRTLPQAIRKVVIHLLMPHRPLMVRQEGRLRRDHHLVIQMKI
jgi:hypothetical protein